MVVAGAIQGNAMQRGRLGRGASGACSGSMGPCSSPAARLHPRCEALPDDHWVREEQRILYKESIEWEERALHQLRQRLGSGPPSMHALPPVCTPTPPREPPPSRHATDRPNPAACMAAALQLAFMQAPPPSVRPHHQAGGHHDGAPEAAPQRAAGSGRVVMRLRRRWPAGKGGRASGSEGVCLCSAKQGKHVWQIRFLEHVCCSQRKRHGGRLAGRRVGAHRVFVAASSAAAARGGASAAVGALGVMTTSAIGGRRGGTMAEVAALSRSRANSTCGGEAVGWGQGSLTPARVRVTYACNTQNRWPHKHSMYRTQAIIYLIANKCATPAPARIQAAP